MKVVYIKNVPKQGKIGEVKEVSNGYAQNFLIPKGLALLATQQNINKTKSSKKRKEKDPALSLIQTEKLAEKIEGTQIKLKEKANEKGTLFASITEKEICGELEKQNIKVDYKDLKLTKHIKEIGEHEAILELNHGLEARIKIIIGKK